MYHFNVLLSFKEVIRDGQGACGPSHEQEAAGPTVSGEKSLVSVGVRMAHILLELLHLKLVVPFCACVPAVLERSQSQRQTPSLQRRKVN